MSWIFKRLHLGLILAIPSLLSVAATGAQTLALAGGSAKVCVINVRQAIASTAEGKMGSAELQSQFSARQIELERLNKQLEDLRQRLSTSGDKLSQEEQSRLTQQGQSLTKQLQRKQEDYQQEANQAQQEIVDRIGRKMTDLLDRYGRENGYVAIFDSSAQGNPVLYASAKVDVTQDIVRLYDQTYPVKASASATAPKSANPKPAAPKS